MGTIIAVIISQKPKLLQGVMSAKTSYLQDDRWEPWVGGRFPYWISSASRSFTARSARKVEPGWTNARAPLGTLSNLQVAIDLPQIPGSPAHPLIGGCLIDHGDGHHKTILRRWRRCWTM